ncbi:hypothetical protein GJ744_001889 [Endocarpon pusillum]|uniref:Myb-like domain-containing protein n=1 Tax=Endocarpon pusillum TaxID=364733 RepID=A0A8H7EA39_9EURO|nr:hypothetical protein GJ744_001889 [Endocarpon pusillum]
MFTSQRRWSPNEDALIRTEAELQSTESKPMNWNKVAEKSPGRSNKDCRKRSYNEAIGSSRNGPWTEEEDSRLASSVARYGMSWVLVAQQMETRSAEQCSKRWQDCLNLDLDRSTWTDGENRCLLSAIHTHGSNWKYIQTLHFPGRSVNNVKNQYTIVKRKYVEIPSDLPPCCPDTGAGENIARHGDSEESFDGVKADFSELMNFDEVIGNKLTTSGMALSHVKKVVDDFEMDLCPFSSDASRLDSGLTKYNQSGGASAHLVCAPLFNRFDHGSGPGLQERPSLASPGVSVPEQQPSRMSRDNKSNQNSSPNAVEKQNLPYNPENLLAAKVEGHELVDSICGSPMGSSNPRTIITLEEADSKTVMEMMDIALRSKAKVKFEQLSAVQPKAEVL